MQESRESPACPRCGGPLSDTGCAACAAGRSAAELTLLPGAGAPVRPRSDVRLVREFKGPTVAEVVAAPPPAQTLLPGVLRTMYDAVQAADLAAAERAADAAVGLLLEGPGHRRRRRWRWLRRLQRLWICLMLVALAAAVLAWLLRGGFAGG